MRDPPEKRGPTSLEACGHGRRWEWVGHGDAPDGDPSDANPVVHDTVHVYYGAADHVIDLATCSLEELLDYARFG
ncbi:MAG TPA: hypothetical protein ENH00_10530 [Actinobacteria bacterium]|nr:hypothetical protein [Actinomycetota bacterium]